MAKVFNTTTDLPVDNRRLLGMVTGAALARYEDLSLASDMVVEQRRGQRTRAARESALERMNASAAQMGADAVIGIRFDSVVVVGGEVEYTAYGTAVKLR